jgi:hypothetical protein
MTISCWILLRARNISNKCCGENQTTRFIFNNFFSENRAVYEIMSKNMVKPERLQWQYGRALHAGLLRLHVRKHTPAPTHARIRTQKCVILIAFDCNSAFVNAPRCYVVCILRLFFLSYDDTDALPACCLVSRVCAWREYDFNQQQESRSSGSTDRFPLCSASPSTCCPVNLQAQAGSASTPYP